MKSLKDVLPAGDKVLYVFYDFDTAHYTRYSERATLHLPNLLCVQQFCSRWSDVEDARVNACNAARENTLSGMIL